ncbi:PREDICTED: uncharacterized protein LOC108579162 [Habropoda laboriosa]|uniref:uncharacterized protein LOC108579162 n=1 Tax=Habropoda laboriosa TaxID=597456 RepID=UPI00083E5E67|nr:PREDICTED: uncharacterized protein LOC108579162 [Habropoda laboriosa]XP_017798105.1 PREDICTED: uncharacterized protein LOC108579162 [Habropoda laboriosa]
MNEEQAERILSVLYISSAILSVTSLTCLVTVWQYWAWSLDVCISIDCGCILYGINTFSTFMGGDVKLCHFGVYGLIPAILIGLCFGGYHGYRCCIDRNLEEPVRIYEDVRRNLNIGDVAPTTATATTTTTITPAAVPTMLVIRPKRRTPYKQWIPGVFLTILLCCLSLAHAVVTTDGYYKTCEQYRKRLIQVLGSAGREAEVLHDRLSCGAIFDFMDYLQSDVSNWKHGKEIDTGFALRLAIISTWFNFLTWTFAFLLNVIMARKRFCCY